MTSIRMFCATAAFALGALSLGLAAPALAQGQDDKIATAKGDLVIHPVHHAAIIFTWNGKRVIADPAGYPPGPKSAAADFPGGSPDIIILTHEHGDHFSVPTLTDLAGPNTVILAPKVDFDMMPDARSRRRRK